MMISIALWKFMIISICVLGVGFFSGFHIGKKISKKIKKIISTELDCIVDQIYSHTMKIRNLL